MIPRTVSASSLQTADGCLARYKAENIDFTPSAADRTAANIGTAVHGALEVYVKVVYMDKTHEPSLALLERYYLESYLKTFDTVDINTEAYKDGLSLVRVWFKRTDLSSVQVLSVETKTRMPVPTSVGPIPLTYIWDRCDFFEENGRRIIRVVDYKTIRANMSPEDLRRKLQARIYDLAARSQFKDWAIDEFQVVFDLLRHEPVGVVFSRDEAIEMWDGIIARIERIIATPDANPPEKLNPDCPWCVRKSVCKTLKKNIAGGGVFALEDIGAVVQQRALLAHQLAGINSALEELDSRIIRHAQEENALYFEVDGMTVNITARKTRVVDPALAGDILGPERMKKYGRVRISDIDKLIKQGELTPDEIEKLNRAMTFTISDPSVKIVSK